MVDSKSSMICYFPVKVLSSAENIAVELATERACGWLSANIAGECFYLELELLTCALCSFFLRSRDRQYDKVLGPIRLLGIFLVESMHLLRSSLFRKNRNYF